MQVASSMRLPLAKVVAGALVLAWERRYALLYALWLPLLLGIAFSVAEGTWGPSSWESGTPEENARMQSALLLWTLPLFALTVVFAVRSYRVYLLGSEQQGHEECGPFYFAVILDENSLRFELLVRSSNNMHCSCISYATSGQRQFVLDFADRLLQEEMIRA